MAVGEGPAKRLSVQEWAEIQARYETGEKMIDLAREYDLSAGTISKRADKYNWKKASDVYDEAMSEARQAVKERARSIHEERIEKANDNQQKIFQFSQKFAFEMLQQLYQNLESIKADREDDLRHQIADAEARGETAYIPRPKYRGLGKLPYEARAAYEMLRDAAMSERVVIYADSFDPGSGGDDGGGSTERLIDIFRAGRLAAMRRKQPLLEGEELSDDEGTQAAESETFSPEA